MSTSPLEKDFPHFAAVIRQASRHDEALKGALADYETACRKEASRGICEAERAEWTRIRREVANEMKRLVQLYSIDGQNP